MSIFIFCSFILVKYLKIVLELIVLHYITSLVIVTFNAKILFLLLMHISSRY